MNFHKEGMFDSRIRGVLDSYLQSLSRSPLNRDLLVDHTVLPGVVVFEGVPIVHLF